MISGERFNDLLFRACRLYVKERCLKNLVAYTEIPLENTNNARSLCEEHCASIKKITPEFLIIIIVLFYFNILQSLNTNPNYS